jgi:hypothetical protein
VTLLQELTLPQKRQRKMLKGPEMAKGAGLKSWDLSVDGEIQMRNPVAQYFSGESRIG